MQTVGPSLTMHVLAGVATPASAPLQDILRGAWSLPLTKDGTTLGTLAVALLGVLAAVLLSKFLARWSARAAGERLRLGATQAEIVARAVFVSAATLLVLTILGWLNIPLTAFAFLGGAIAIGVGFGAQNLMNNFISGLILLLERQIRLGDIIEIGPNLGTITHLGSRCSRLRRFDGVEVLIPNSALLEKDVTNWTLNDPHHRYEFTLGVAYGSPVERVITVLESATREEPGVLADPAPTVFFESFGESSLVFRVFFWLALGGPHDARVVGSNIRRRIAEELERQGIEMPFPQRDLRLRTSPISVRIEKS